MRFTSFVLALGLVVGCAAGPAPVPSADERRRDEIIALHNRLMDMRHEVGLQPRPADAFLRATRETKDKDAIAWCAPATAAAPACEDVCDLAEYVCAAKDDICRLAGELGDDAWARGKCDFARASCCESRERCRTCK